VNKEDLSIVVIGAGAIGGITAAFLKKNGYNVEVVCGNSEYAKLISDTGLKISGTGGEFSIKIPAYASAAEIRTKKDLILHATKANDIAASSESAKAILKDDGHVVSLQNGICEDALAEIFGRERIIGCVTGWGATYRRRGELEMTSTGDFILGYTDKPPDQFLDELAELLSCIVPVQVTDNITGHLYSKLIINSCISSLGVVCGWYLGEMLAVRKIRRIFIEIIREAVKVADGMNIRIEVFGGRLDFKKFLEGEGMTADLRRHLVIRFVGFKYRRLKSSSLQSLERGKRTEVDYLNGYIVKNAAKLNIQVPANLCLVELIHEIEEKKREISFENFDSPVFERFND
jgi:2-dehydropantoate 2-reductase